MPDKDYERKVKAVNRRFFWAMVAVFAPFVVISTIIGILVEVNEPADGTPVLVGFLIGAALGSVTTMLTVPRHYNKELERIKREQRVK